MQVNQLNQNTFTTTFPTAGPPEPTPTPNPAQHAEHGQIPRPNTAHHSPAPSKQWLCQRLKLWQSQLPGSTHAPCRPPLRAKNAFAASARAWACASVAKQCACLENRRGPNRLGGVRRAQDPEHQVQGRGLDYIEATFLEFFSWFVLRRIRGCRWYS